MTFRLRGQDSRGRRSACQTEFQYFSTAVSGPWLLDPSDEGFTRLPLRPDAGRRPKDRWGRPNGTQIERKKGLLRRISRPQPFHAIERPAPSSSATGKSDGMDVGHVVKIQRRLAHLGRARLQGSAAHEEGGPVAKQQASLRRVGENCGE